ncbi:hypothetical protein DVA44_19335 [Leclercia sp. W17]|nr:hypothetical protein DVA44_19335 [Leclercia sp. W17]
MKSLLQKRAGIQRKLMGFGTGLKAATIAMGSLKNGRIPVARSMMYALIVAETERVRRQHGAAVVDGVAMTVRNRLTDSVSQKLRPGSCLMMNTMRWIFGTKPKPDVHGVKLKYPPMNHTTPARKSINAMNASVTSS